MLHLFCQDQLGGWVQVKMKEKILALRCIYKHESDIAFRKFNVLLTLKRGKGKKILFNRLTVVRK